MKVLDLCCSNDHRFEGWFGSEADFQSQSGRALVECPICADTAVSRLPSAPRLNVSKSRALMPSSSQAQPQMQAQTQTPSPTEAQTQAQIQMQQHWLRALRQVIAATEDVGERFPEEARRIHYGEVEERGIRGHASRADADALREEGIEVMVLPLPAALKGTVQ